MTSATTSRCPPLLPSSSSSGLCVFQLFTTGNISQRSWRCIFRMVGALAFSEATGGGKSGRSHNLPRISRCTPGSVAAGGCGRGDLALLTTPEGTNGGTPPALTRALVAAGTIAVTTTQGNGGFPKLRTVNQSPAPAPTGDGLPARVANGPGHTTSGNSHRTPGRAPELKHSLVRTA